MEPYNHIHGQERFAFIAIAKSTVAMKATKTPEPMYYHQEMREIENKKTTGINQERKRDPLKEI